MSEFVDAWREASWRERWKGVVFFVKFSPLILLGLTIRVGEYALGEADRAPPRHSNSPPGGEVDAECLCCGCEFTVARGRLLDERQLEFCRWCRHEL